VSYVCKISTTDGTKHQSVQTSVLQNGYPNAGHC